jgi:hypothetical protein
MGKVSRPSVRAAVHFSAVGTVPAKSSLWVLYCQPVVPQIHLTKQLLKHN